MKANELMIGDWVLWTFNDDTYPEKIGSLVYGDVGYEPIILTEEILKANGFYDFKEVEVSINSFDDIFGKRMRNVVFPRTIKYVHELQHALRLCGLNELANNFKIK